MGIQINGINDIISASDGSFTISGADLSNLPNLNVSGIATVTTLSVTNANPVNLNVSGITTVSAGSTSAPSITPSGDPNTGIFFPAADIIAFAEGGAEVGRFDSNGRLGIGTTTPTVKLQVSGAIRIADETSMSLLLSRSSNGEITNQHFFVAAANSPWYLYGENLTWTAERAGTTRTSQKPYYEGYNPSVGGRDFGFVNKTSADTSFSATDLVPSLTLRNNGTVGIGSDSPTSKLEVQGDARIVGVLTATSNIKIGSNTVATTGKAIAMAMVFS